MSEARLYRPGRALEDFSGAIALRSNSPKGRGVDLTFVAKGGAVITASLTLSELRSLIEFAELRASVRYGSFSRLQLK
jgi:hypothetical protein